MAHVFLTCGCAAQAVCSKRAGVNYDPPIPACVIHDCIEVAAVPDLSLRRARCAYFGRGNFRLYECNYRATTGCTRTRCTCELSSSLDLPFFQTQPDKPFDIFFCGCAGWD